MKIVSCEKGSRQKVVRPVKANPDYTEFFENFEIVEVISCKSMLVRCAKLKGRRFMLKEFIS